MVTFIDRAGLKGKSIRPGPGLREGIGTDASLGELRHIFFLLIVARPSHESVGHERVMDIDKNRYRRVDPSELLDRQDGIKDRRPRSAIFLGRLDSHQTKLEALFDQALIELAGVLHLFDERPYLALGKLADG